MKQFLLAFTFVFLLFEQTKAQDTKPSEASDSLSTKLTTFETSKFRLDRVLQTEVGVLSYPSGDPLALPKIGLRSQMLFGPNTAPTILWDGMPIYDKEVYRHLNLNLFDSYQIDPMGSFGGFQNIDGTISLQSKTARKDNKWHVGISGRTGISYSENIELMNAQELIQFKQKYGNNFEEINYEGNGTDWLDEVSRTGLENDYAVNLSRGNDKYSFLTGVSYSDIQGVRKGNEMNRYSLFAKGSYKPVKTLSLNASLFHSKLQGEEQNDAFQSARDISPLYKTTDSGFSTEEIDSYHDYYSDGIRNPLTMIENDLHEDESSFSRANIGLNYTPNQFVKLSAKLNWLESKQEKKDEFSYSDPRLLREEIDWNGNFTLGRSSSVIAYKNEKRENFHQLGIDLKAEFNLPISNNQKLRFIPRLEHYRFRNHSSKKTYNIYGGGVNVSYFINDGEARITRPSLSIAYNVSDILDLNASYIHEFLRGKTENNQLLLNAKAKILDKQNFSLRLKGNYNFIETHDELYSLSAVGEIEGNQLSMPFERPIEYGTLAVNHWDLGLETSFLNSFTFALNYYQKTYKSINLLDYMRIPHSSGFQRRLHTMTFGDYQLSGLEGSLSFSKKINAIQLFARLNFISFEEEILNFPHEYEDGQISLRLKEGTNLRNHIINKYDIIKEGPNKGRYDYDSQRTENFGSRTPRQIYTFNQGLAYNNWELNFSLYAQTGQVIRNWNYNNSVYEHGIIKDIEEKAYHPEHKPEGTILVDYFSSDENVVVEKADFLRLQSLQIAYNLPKESLEKLSLENARFYLDAQNLWTSASYSGVSPEIYGGKDNGTYYNVPKTISLGFQLGF